jgi:hypothetical protein
MILLPSTNYNSFDKTLKGHHGYYSIQSSSESLYKPFAILKLMFAYRQIKEML